MDKNTSHKIVRETFQNPFQKERFVYFIKNLLNNIEEAPFVYRGNIIPKIFKADISSLERVGKYSDGEHEIDILIVNLLKATSIQRARTMQRNFIAWYLNGSRGGKMKDAALAAFVSPNQDDWRFSLVKMDYKFEEGKKGKIKVKEELTPARRWSFLVGKNENSHTAQSRLAPIVADDEHNPVLKQLEEAFNIEKVTKEFFEKYRELFLWTKETLEAVIKKDAKVKNDFKDKNISTADFTKKLLGQIVFLYFLQKKGWFGVPMSKNWGEGDKKFLRSLFIEADKKSSNYFNDYMEPLFYEALAKERDEDFYSRFECKIPFLNGGLFDPISNYDWVNTAINLPNELFSNANKTNEGDTGNGILDIFDRYNFTVKEDEPLEKEVAVDPEMLGKVFENLLEVKDRKSKGTYYTPREIVHYMCQQSLINYLKTETKIDEKNIEKVVKQDILLTKDEFLAWQKNNHKPVNKALALWEGEWEQLDKALEKIRIVDPACGSGAFLVGMLNEIIRSRKLLQLYSQKAESLYALKERTIKNCIYGVDIDPSAVEIAKLRLWLSLVVDEEDIKQIKPLPNLDYKIMQGNSLLEEFEGIKLFDEKLLQAPIIDARVLESDNQRIISLQNKLLKYYEKNPQWMQKKNTTRPKEVVDLESQLSSLLKKQKHISENSAEQKDLFTSISESWQIRQELEKLHKKFFGEAVKKSKDEIKRRIEKLEWDLIETTLKEQKKTSALKKLEQFKKSNIKPFFLWKLHFADVFQEKGGFDVVIANPPYVEHKKLKDISNLLKGIYKTYSGTADLYVYFYEVALNILREKGILTFISSNKFIKVRYGSNLRSLLSKNRIHNIVDFTNVKIFDALVASCIVLVSKSKAADKVIVTFANDNFVGNLPEFIKNNHIEVPSKLLCENIWQLEDDSKLQFKQKIESDTKRLGEVEGIKIFRGITTGYNPAFIIDSETKQSLISSNQNNKHVIKPLLQGRDIKRWIYKYSNNFLLFIPWHFPLHNDSSIQGASKTAEKAFQGKYPNIYGRLMHYKEDLYKRNTEETGKRYEWYALQRSANTYYPEFEKEKIIWGLTADKWAFAYDNEKHFLPSNGYILTSGKIPIKYILALLNSTLMRLYFGFIGIMTAGGAYTLKHETISEFPIKLISESDQKPIILIVDKILALARSTDYSENIELQAKVREYEKQIDEMVYKLYGLTEKEINIVKGSK